MRKARRTNESEILKLAREIASTEGLAFNVALAEAMRRYAGLMEEAADYDHDADYQRLEALATQRPPTA